MDIISWLNLILGMALLFALTLSGHASAVGSDILIYAVMLDWLHLLAASLWVGGMIYIATIYLPTLKENALLAACTLTNFHTSHTTAALAITGIIILLVTGPFTATVHMNSFDQLTTTAYGRSTNREGLLVAALMVTSALHIGLLRPRLLKTIRSI